MKGALVVLLFLLTALMAVSFIYNKYSYPAITGLQSYDVISAGNNTFVEETAAEEPVPISAETPAETPVEAEIPAASSEEVGAVIQSLVEDKSFASLGDGAAFCIVVEAGSNNAYYYELLKYKGQPLITEKYCAEPNQNNIIVKFNSYNSLLEFRSDPKKFLTEKRNSDYYIFPSNYVFNGGAVNCPVSFQLRYCGAFYSHFTKDELAGIQMPCCAYSKFSPAGLAFFIGGAFDNGWLLPLAVLAVIIAASLLFYRRKKHAGKG